MQVWRLWVDTLGPGRDDLAMLLSDEERARADRFRFAPDRRRFVVTHAWLRQILGHYLDRDPGEVRFVPNRWGKPEIDGEAGSMAVGLSISHSADLALAAIACGRRVGVDVERIRDDIDVMAIADGQFAPTERRALHALPPAMRCRAFFTCWTRKEAYVKADGRGLSIPFDAFDVAVSSVEPAGLLSASWESGEASLWSWRDLDAAPGYAAALVVEGRHPLPAPAWQEWHEL
ncbi:MAG: 4'-phosphopantetheinyl transferase family protein [Acidimicrobiales bacterium]